ncbi:MAG: hypothetical protein OXF01_01830 [Gemmatimonadetes bacterium]|nr:hypothetical protein [Gemmatimonadota bacterium]
MTRISFLPPVPARRAHPKRLRPLGRRLACLLASVGAIAPLACDNPLFPDRTHVVVGHVDFDGPFFHDTVQVADTVTANVPLEITFRTAGGGCHEGGHTEVRVAGPSAIVTPYDSLMVPSFGGCTQPLRSFWRTAIVVFPDPGTALVELRYSTDMGNSPEDHNSDGRKVYTVEVLSAN